jgi:hypothetical protein
MNMIYGVQYCPLTIEILIELLTVFLLSVGKRS